MSVIATKQATEAVARVRCRGDCTSEDGSSGLMTAGRPNDGNWMNRLKMGFMSLNRHRPTLFLYIRATYFLGVWQPANHARMMMSNAKAELLASNCHFGPVAEKIDAS